MNQIKKTPNEKKFPPVRIFWEDFKFIEDIFKENFENYTIVIDEVEYNSLDEILEEYKSPVTLKIRIKNLKFISCKPYFFTLEMSRDHTIIHSATNDDKISGVEEQLKNLLQKRYLPNSFFNKPLFQRGAPIVLGILLISLAIFRNNYNLILPISIACFLLAIMMYCFGNQYYKPILTIFIEPEKE